ncbi:MAG: M20/M25/M40 family metallo-hydrolase [Deltaproteobacteria bacterium]|nr:M20/M25/M40 family metallo-hydrolase [Deltaproteobacteria bacterium]
MSWDLLEEAKKIIGINSVTYESNRSIVDYVTSLLKPLDLEVKIQKGECYDKEQFNIIAKKGPLEGDTLLFCTHLDTVSPGDSSLWTKTGGNPFNATIEGDKIYGLGTADVKLDALCKIKALEKFKGVPFKNPFIFAATYGEETGLAGAKKLVSENSIKPKYAVVGEPSNLSIVYAHKGFLTLEFTLVDAEAKETTLTEPIFKIDFFGRSAHSSTPQLGINAVQKALDFLKTHKGKYEFISLNGGELINVIPDKAFLKIKCPEKLISEDEGLHLYTEKLKKSFYVFTPAFVEALEDIQTYFKKLFSEFKKSPLPEFDPPTSVLNIGVISTQENKVRFFLGIRLLPTANTDEILIAIQTQMDTITKKYPTIQMTKRVARLSLPMKTDLTSKLIMETKNVLRSMGLQETLITKSSSTEASVYRALGAEAIVWGPGVSVGNVHKPNEFNYTNHLTHAVTFYEKMIEQFCVK